MSERRSIIGRLARAIFRIGLLALIVFSATYLFERLNDDPFTYSIWIFEFILVPFIFFMAIVLLLFAIWLFLQVFLFDNISTASQLDSSSPGNPIIGVYGIIIFLVVITIGYILFSGRFLVRIDEYFADVISWVEWIRGKLF